MILLLDNFDSFVYNLSRMFEELGREALVVRSNAIDLETVRGLRPEAIVISPGPGEPRSAGISLDVVRKLQGRIPILGVCLGHQVIADACGAHVVRGEPVHGRADLVFHDGAGIFRSLPNPFRACRYHSLVVSPEDLPPLIQVTASTPEGTIMALRHRQLPLTGLQFHPESILTEHGASLLRNFLADLDSCFPHGLQSSEPQKHERV